MKILDSNEYINEKLDIKPVTKDMLSKMKEEPFVDEEAKRFIEDNNLKWNPKKMCYDCEGKVSVSEDIITDGKLKIRFGKVGDDFSCSGHNLTSLKGAPNEVVGSFHCSDNKLTTLEGAPTVVGRSFDCSNNNLTTLEGAPKEIVWYFDCSGNRLTTLEGAPNKVGRHFYCDNNRLTTLEGAPNEVGGHFGCRNNRLTSLEGAPQEVGGDFHCNSNPNLVLPKRKPSWLKGKIYN